MTMAVTVMVSVIFAITPTIDVDAPAVVVNHSKDLTQHHLLNVCIASVEVVAVIVAGIHRASVAIVKHLLMLIAGAIELFELPGINSILIGASIVFELCVLVVILAHAILAETESVVVIEPPGLYISGFIGIDVLNDAVAARVDPLSGGIQIAAPVAGSGHEGLPYVIAVGVSPLAAVIDISCTVAGVAGNVCLAYV